MEQRTLGRTGIGVGAVGLGTEYLNGQPRDTVVPLVRDAMDRGVTYIDLFFGHAPLRDDVGLALRGRRQDAVVAGHLGSALRGQQYQKTRNAKASETFFLDLLKRLETDYIDVLMLHFVDLDEEYERVFHHGPLDMAKRFQREGKARFIGMSGHNLATAVRAVRSGEIDVLMYPVNPAGASMPDRDELFRACVAENVGLVAMKPFAGGKLLQSGGAVSLGTVHSGWRGLRSEITHALTPVQCMAYTLEQPGVTTVVPGVKSTAELVEALRVFEATAAERDLSALRLSPEAFRAMGCVYCNHCLPCPVEIDIGQTLRLAETGQWSVSEDLRDAYFALGARASACTECGACTSRCPYGVDVIPAMKRAAELFETP